MMNNLQFTNKPNYPYLQQGPSASHFAPSGSVDAPRNHHLAGFSRNPPPKRTTPNLPPHTPFATDFVNNSPGIPGDRMKSHSLTKQSNLVQEMNQDLSRLREQLKKLMGDVGQVPQSLPPSINTAPPASHIYRPQPAYSAQPVFTPRQNSMDFSKPLNKTFNDVRPQNTFTAPTFESPKPQVFFQAPVPLLPLPVQAPVVNLKPEAQMTPVQKLYTPIEASIATVHERVPDVAPQVTSPYESTFTLTTGPVESQSFVVKSETAPVENPPAIISAQPEEPKKIQTQPVPQIVFDSPKKTTAQITVEVPKIQQANNRNTFLSPTPNKRTSERASERRDVSPVSVRLGNVEENLQKQLENKFQQIKKLRQQKSKAEDRVRELEEKVQQLQNAAASNAGSAQSNSFWEAKHQQLVAQNATLRAQIEQDIKDKNSLIKKLDIVTKTAAEQVRKPVGLSNQLAAQNQYEEAVRGLRQTKSRLQRELEHSQKEVRTLKQKLEEKYLTSSSYPTDNQDETSLVVQLQKQNILLKQQVMQSKTMGFDGHLKSHLEEASRYKESLNDRNSQIHRLEEVNRIQKSQIDRFQNEYEVLRLKFIGETKALETRFENDKLALQNQLETVRKNSIAVASKLKLYVDENKRKDEFVKQWVTGKVYSEKDKLDVKEFFKQYALSVLPGNSTEA